MGHLASSSNCSCESGTACRATPSLLQPGQTRVQGLASMKAVAIARLQYCSLVLVPEADAQPPHIRVSTFALIDE